MNLKMHLLTIRQQSRLVLEEYQWIRWKKLLTRGKVQ